MSGSVLSDDLLRQLMAAGQVDILVGVPTLNNAATVGTVVEAVHRSFASHFLRDRTVLIALDGGSTDGTPAVVREASSKASETVIAAQALRTIHRISAPYHGVPGKGSALRALFAAAELLQARSVALFDPDVTSIDADWVDRLVRPVHREGLDFVLPSFARRPGEGPLATQIVRPFFRAVFGHRVHDPLAAEFGCSGRFAAHCSAHEVWDSPFARYGVDLWLTAAALTGGFRCAQAALGPRVTAPRADRPSLAEVFRQIVGSLFECLEGHREYWLRRSGSEAVALLGTSPEAPSAPGLDEGPMLAAFRTGVRDLKPVLTQILAPGTLAELEGLAAREGRAAFPDGLWVATVYDAAAAFHREAIHKEHLTQALVPLYLGRTAAFVAESAGRSDAASEEALESLSLEFEARKPYLLERWGSEK